MWNVLIVESDLECCKHIIHGLNKVAWCTIVRDGRQVINAYEKSIRLKKPFDFILIELNIEPLTGFDIIQQIRQWEDTSNNILNQEVSIIVVSSYSESLLKKYNIGWDDFITKPIEVDKMIRHMMALKKDRANHSRAVSLQRLLV